MSVYRALTLTIAFLWMHVLCCFAAGEGNTAGFLQSPKGIGLGYERLCSERVYNSYFIYADIWPVLAGEASEPGLKIDISHCEMYHLLDLESKTFDWIGGGGFSAGYVRDIGARVPGFCPAVLAKTGFRLSYDRGYIVELSWQAELGLSITRGAPRGNLVSSLYKAGLKRAWMPQVKILYRF